MEGPSGVRGKHMSKFLQSLMLCNIDAKEKDANFSVFAQSVNVK